MNEDGDDFGNSTRRSVLTGNRTLETAGLFAGCPGQGGTGTTETSQTKTETATGATPIETPTETDASDGSYTVSIDPVRWAESESVSETGNANTGSWADTGITLGLGAPKGVWLTTRYHTSMTPRFRDAPSMTTPMNYSTTQSASQTSSLESAT
ncbi:hypothetical protein C440_17106 [Haloferax mucosum ATCC BAA-1512]|uniref:Uncharacterized protein n=1 Tax=Haloferax mucosum ATCC BAA-1512 TaxID=662479 RepID=M0I416_9EURY|nr:hypothetical protein [Haloferax mucosum]ELZ90144.1 hypothetical protein C440_17106 [Haloferax mucosum ATCC BAA-1512]